MNNIIKPMTIPGIHDRFYKFLKTFVSSDSNLKILDVGAGHGAFTKKLYDEGYQVSACDLFPELFYFNKINCKKADITKSLPYEDNSFDIIIGIEIMEHVFDHEVFFRECYRILKPYGKLIISTPNILSLKSRLRFFFTGFFYSFKPLELKNYDGLQHVASLTVNQYNYLGMQNGFKCSIINIDKKQKTSISLSFLWPFLWIYSKVKKVDFNVHNKINLLMGRKLFLTFETEKNKISPVNPPTIP